MERYDWLFLHLPQDTKKQVLGLGQRRFDDFSQLSARSRRLTSSPL
jgi:hypothetical protein